MSGLNLSKGASLPLTKDSSTEGTPLKEVAIGLGWEFKQDTFDIDVSIIPSSSNGSVEAKDVLYYGSPKVDGKPTTLGGAMVHSGDNLTGTTGGDASDARNDAEEIIVDLTAIPSNIERLNVVANIYNARSKKFGDLQKAYARISEKEGATKTEKIFTDLDADAPTNNCMLVYSIRRTPSGWEIEAVNHGFDGDLNEAIQQVQSRYAVTAQAAV